MPQGRGSSGLTQRVARRHPEVARVRRLVRRAGERASEGVFVAEGPRVLEQLVASGAEVERVLVRTDGVAEAGALGLDDRTLVVDDDVLESVADSRSPQGPLAVVRRPEGRLPAPSSDRVVVLDGLGDPGNVGTAIRSAVAFGAETVCVVGGADPYGPKAVRASAGSVVAAAPAVLDPAAALAACRAAGLDLVVLSADGDDDLDRSLTGRSAFVVGHETRGPSEGFRAAADAVVALPTTGRVESLNAGVTASIILAMAHRAAPSTVGDR